MLSVSRVQPSHPEFIRLTAELDEVLQELNACRHEFFDRQNQLDDTCHAVLAYDDGLAIGCGAFRAVRDDTVEIKRMYVRPEARGAGVGKLVLSSLELWASERGFGYATLETSHKLNRAVNLYLRNGYEKIPNFPPYEEVDTSVCFRKLLRSEIQKETQ